MQCVAVLLHWAPAHYCLLRPVACTCFRASKKLIHESQMLCREKTPTEMKLIRSLLKSSSVRTSGTRRDQYCSTAALAR